MGRRSKIAALPPDILEQLQAMLRDPRVSQLEATRLINAVIESQSTGEEIPEDLHQRISAAIADARMADTVAARSIGAILDWCKGVARSVTPVCKSSVNAYAMRMEKVGERMRQSREMAEMWIGKLGAAPQGKLGHLVNEILRTLSFDLAITLQRGAIDVEEAPQVAKMLRDLAVACEKLESAATMNVRREEEIIKAERARAAEKLRELESEAAKDGTGKRFDADTLRRVRQEIYGLAA